MEIFAEVVDGQSLNRYSPAALNATLSTAETYSFEVRSSQVAGTVYLAVGLQWSNDGENWTDPILLLDDVQISADPQTNFASHTAVGSVGGLYARVSVSVVGVNSVAYVEVWVTGRASP